MNPLTSAQIRALRAQAHPLKPVVSISQKGLTESVIMEIDRCLKAHELIKLRIYGHERGPRETLATAICGKLECALVQHLGNLLILWREKTEEENAEVITPGARSRSGKPMTKKQAADIIERRAAKRTSSLASSPPRPRRTSLKRT